MVTHRVRTLVISDLHLGSALQRDVLRKPVALAALTTHWMAPLGLIILAVVILAKRGLWGSFHAWALRREQEGRHG